MLTQPTINHLRSLKLDGMVRAFEEQLGTPIAHGLSFEERFGLLVDRELAWRDTRRLDRLLKQARLKFPGACVEDIIIDASRGLDASLLASLGTGDWIRHGHSVIATGATGAGKTWLACAFGRQAARLDHGLVGQVHPRSVIAHADDDDPLRGPRSGEDHAARHDLQAGRG